MKLSPKSFDHPVLLDTQPGVLLVVGLGILLNGAGMRSEIELFESFDDCDRKLIEKLETFDLGGDRIPESFESSPLEASESED